MNGLIFHKSADSAKKRAAGKKQLIDEKKGCFMRKRLN